MLCVLIRKHNIPFQYEKDNRPTLSQICSNGIFSMGLKNEFETSHQCSSHRGSTVYYDMLYAVIEVNEKFQLFVTPSLVFSKANYAESN